MTMMGGRLFGLSCCVWLKGYDPMKEIEQVAEEEIRKSLKRDAAPDDEALAVRHRKDAETAVGRRVPPRLCTQEIHCMHLGLGCRSLYLYLRTPDS